MFYFKWFSVWTSSAITAPVKQLCFVTQIVPRSQISDFSALIHLGKRFQEQKKKRIKWYISWRRDEKKYMQLFMHLSNIKCLLQRKCLYVVSGKTDPDFQVQVPRKWMIAARLGSWCSRHCNGHLWAAECCRELNLVSAEYRRSYQGDCRFPYHLSF